MSVDIYACWKGDLTVGRPALQDALVALGFRATVLYEIIDAEGYWPIDLDGLRTGVQVFLQEIDEEEMQEDYPGLASALDGRDHLGILSFGGDAAEAGAANALAAALARCTDGLVFDPQSAEILTLDEACALARRFFDEARAEGYREREED